MLEDDYIWDLWYREAALIFNFKDGQPVWDHTAGIVYILPTSDLLDEAVIKAIIGSLGKNI
jgi:hypothetical protein